jgi:hypothetical protein
MHRSNGGFVRLFVFCFVIVAFLILCSTTGVWAQQLGGSPFGVKVPAERSLSIPPPKAVLKPDNDVLQRVNTAYGISRLSQMNFVGEANVTLGAETGPTVVSVTVLRTAQRGQRVLFKQADGKARDIDIGLVDRVQLRVRDFVETQYTRGLANLLGATTRSTVVLDGGDKDGAHALVVRETEGPPTRYVLDSATSLLTRMEFQRGQSPDASGRQFPNLESYIFSDFRTVDGLVTPFKVEHYINGAKQEELQFTSVQYVAAHLEAAPPPTNRESAQGPIRGGLR